MSSCTRRSDPFTGSRSIPMPKDSLGSLLKKKPCSPSFTPIKRACLDPTRNSQTHFKTTNVMVDNFFSALLQNAGSRVGPAIHTSRFLLDKNEQSDDIDMALKTQVVDCLLRANWNRYPASDYAGIEAKVAEYCNLQPDNIVLSAGSASIITTLLDYFALNRKKITITQPSYSLFDYHCKTYNIPYQPWLLTPELEYDLERLPVLDAESVLIITSPNNPVGNTLDRYTLESLLRANPDSLIILDAVYCEFSDTDYTPLVRQYDNLIVLRSFSKAFPIAGLRLGYLCASPRIATIVRKLILQFSITHFSLIFAHEMLFNPAFMENAQMRVREITGARDSMYESLRQNFTADRLKVFRSEGNFLLIRLFEDSDFSNVMACLKGNGIKVLNTSAFPLLQNTFRVSIGNPGENTVFYECLEKNLNQRQAACAPAAVPGINLAAAAPVAGNPA
ncbi:MAG: aminotransferase class I/II-fold pyridoxal phosphate-dependent enzyme [Bacteroidetes bacterium]|nr:MAG: aminotransferase class I/II-fold pyridoxal phosphate-dependent enzyme [Bacteroidota bacterium]